MIMSVTDESVVRRLFQ